MDPEDQPIQDPDKIDVVIDLSGNYDYSFDANGTYIGGAGVDTITISNDFSATGVDYSNMGTITLSAPSTSYTVGAVGSAAGTVLTSNGSGTSWANSSFTFSDSTSSSSFHISGENPTLKTDLTEINLNDLGKVIETLKGILDLDQIPIFDKAFRDRHEILQHSWEDVKIALENYRITEALLRSTPPGDDNDQ